MTGFWLTLCMLLTYLIILVTRLIINKTGSNLLSSDTFALVLGTVPIYICAFLYFFMMKRPPAMPASHVSLSKKQIVILYFIGEACLTVGNLIGVVLGLVINSIFKIQSSNTTIQMLSKTNIPVLLIVAIIIGPIFEELIYRKFFIDRVGGYVPAAAIIMSGLCFGLFHQNLYQFFYTTALGCLFAFIYLSTGKNLINTLMHILMNFIHSFVPFIIMRHINLDVLTESAGDLSKMLSTASENPDAMMGTLKTIYTPWFIMLMIYSIFIFAAAIIGVIFFIIHFKLIKSLVPKGFTDTKTALKQILIQPFIITFIVTHIALAVLTLII